MKNKSPRRRCPFIRNINNQVISTHRSKDKTGYQEKPPSFATAIEDTRVLECQRQLLQVINFFSVKDTYSNLHFCICMSNFQLKNNFASCDKALTKTVTQVLSDEEVGFPFSTERLNSPPKIWQAFLLVLWVGVSHSNNHLKQNQF